MERHQHFMEQALALAQRGEGQTSPNPAVGCVIVKENEVVGNGYHRQAGAPHAEVEALRDAGELAQGATLYVTLEPCNHHGRTPPCTEAILQAGITQVFYATGDPNPQVAGGGHQRLIQAGIQIQQGPCTSEAQHLNRFFFHYSQTQQPYVVAKSAASLDGKIATHTGQSQWITGPDARQKAHTLRHQVDAILVGASTAIADDPRLTIRLGGNRTRTRADERGGGREGNEMQTTADEWGKLRIVLDSRGRVPLSAKLFQPDLPGQTLVATTQTMSDDHRESLAAQGVEVVILPPDDAGQVNIDALLHHLGQHQIMSLMVEGGSEVLGSFFTQKKVQEVWAFLAPMIIGGRDAPGPVGNMGFAELAQSCHLESTTLEAVGKDFLIRGFVRN